MGKRLQFRVVLEDWHPFVPLIVRDSIFPMTCMHLTYVICCLPFERGLCFQSDTMVYDCMRN